MLRANKFIYSSILLLFTFLFPTFPALTRTGGAGRLGEMMLVFIILAILLLYTFIYNSKIRLVPLLTGLFVTSIFILLISVSIINESQFITVRDLYEYHKPILIFMIFCFFLSFDWKDENLEKYFLKPLYIIFVFFICYSILEVFFGRFGTFISTIFYKQNRPVLYNKATGSFGVTYFFATFMLLSSLLFFFRYILTRHFKDFIFFLGSVLALVTTQSRTLFIALALAFVYIFLTYWMYRGFPFKKRLYLGTLLFIVVLFVIWDALMLWASQAFPYLYSGLDYLIRSGGVDAEGVGSANVRYQQLLWAWDNQSSFPLFGAGIGKGTGPQLESFYALYLYRYGFLGIFVALIIMIYNYFLAIKCYRLARNRKHISAAAFFLAFSVFCVVLPISSLSSVITDQVRFAILYYGTTALMITYRYNCAKQGTSNLL